ncbi:MAG: siderophore-interacting protein [Caulobacteraceae bacterium]|nr:siderophore-interacting protein [Caulobacteraceae bacterium]
MSQDAPTATRLKRVRIEPKRRTLTVVAIEALTPGMRRIRFQSPALQDFSSLSPDDHIKLFFTGADGATIMRDYTPRGFDNAAATLVIDFALHEAGPATAWAIAAKVGDTLEIGGPRGSTVVPDVFAWYLLIGDETALPAIARRVEELPPGTAVTTIVTVDSAKEIQSFKTTANWTAEWVLRDIAGQDDIANVRQAIGRLTPTTANGFVWIAGEAQFARSLRVCLIEEHGHPAIDMKAAGYWVRGAEGAHQPLD